MSFFTLITTNVRAKRAAVVLYALILFSLAVFGHYGFAAEGRGNLLWVTVVIGVVSLYLVAQISRGRLDRRLSQVSLWLFVANLAILCLYLILFWNHVRQIGA